MPIYKSRKISIWLCYLRWGKSNHTWDGLSSIVRGKKVVIAGDTKQLPTPDFKNIGQIELDEDEEEIVEFDSILDVANAGN